MYGETGAIKAWLIHNKLHPVKDPSFPNVGRRPWPSPVAWHHSFCSGRGMVDPVSLDTESDIVISNHGEIEDGRRRNGLSTISTGRDAQPDGAPSG